MTTQTLIDGFSLDYGTRVIGDCGLGRVVEARSAGMLRVDWDMGPDAYSRELGDYIGSTEWDLLEGRLVDLRVI